jgi:hypothetical protein
MTAYIDMFEHIVWSCEQEVVKGCRVMKGSKQRVMITYLISCSFESKDVTWNRGTIKIALICPNPSVLCSLEPARYRIEAVKAAAK